MIDENSVTTAFTGVHTVEVDQDSAGQRIDNYLLARSKGVPRSHIYRIIRTGQVRVNGGRVKATYKLLASDKVRIPPLVTNGTAEVNIPDKIIQLLEGSILLETDSFIAVNKPAGIAVHKGTGLHFGIVEAFRQSRSGPSGNAKAAHPGAGQRLELVHRLDRGTSGCLLIGKGLKRTRELQDLFRAGKVGKNYVALTVGHWPSDKTVSRPLLKNQASGGERVVQVSPEGKSAVSHFKVSQRFAAATLVQVQIETGRTHQIRVHAASEGHALVGDEKYGGSAENRHFRKLGLKRLYLHCASLELQAKSPVIVCAETGPQWRVDLDKLSPVCQPKG